MSAIVDEWCDYHHNLHNISRGRRVMQRRVLHEFAAQIPGPVELVDGPDLERFMATMIAGGYHPHTVVRNLRLIRPFLRWLRHQGHIDAERWLRLQDVRPPRGAYDGKPRPYSRPEIRRFWIELEERYPWTFDANPEQRTPARGEHWVQRWAKGQSGWKRVYPYAARLQIEAVVALALYGGLRRDEIYNLAPEDMRYLGEYVRVLSRKGAEGVEKVRIVPINRAMRLAIGNWTEFRRQVLAPDHDFPWLCLWAGRGSIYTEPTWRMSHTQFCRLLTRTGSGWTFHRLRHTFATERYRANMPIEVLKEIMGHANIRQTLAYTRVDEDRIIAASQTSDEQFLASIRDQPDDEEQAA